MRVPSVDKLTAIFFERWAATREPEEVVKAIRDAVLVGVAKAKLRTNILERRRRRGASPAPQSRLREANAGLLYSIATARGVDVRQIVEHDRSRTASRVRFEAMWVLRHVRKMSYPEIGTVVGNRTPMVAMRAVRIVEERTRREPGLAAKLRRIAGR